MILKDMNISAQPAVAAPLDRAFKPAVSFNRCYRAAVQASGKGVPLVLGLERENGLISRFETVVSAQSEAATVLYVERIVKFLLWARGGWKLHFGGPKADGRIHPQNLFVARGAESLTAR